MINIRTEIKQQIQKREKLESQKLFEKVSS